MEDSNSVRCKACDKKFSSSWDSERKRWEDLCWECLAVAMFWHCEDEEELTTIIPNLPTRSGEGHE